MRSELLRIIGYKGIQHFEAKPDRIMALTGGNGQGKTTVLDAVRSVSEGGSEPDSINIDCDEAEIKLVIVVERGDHKDYDPGRYEITRKIRRDGYGLTVKGPKGTRIPKEQTFVNIFLPKIGYDPLAFDALSDSERAEKLQSFLRVPATTDEIRKAAGLVELGPIKEDRFDDGIAAIDGFIDTLKEQASEIRVTVKNLAGSIATFETALEGRSVEVVAADLRTANEWLESRTEDLTAAKDRLTEERNRQVLAAAAEEKTAIAKIEETYKTALAALNETRATGLKQAEEHKTNLLSLAEAEFNMSSDRILAPITESIGLARGKVLQLEEKQAEAERLIGERAQLEKWRKLHIDKNDELERLTTSTSQLLKLRVKKLSKADMGDLSIIGGKLYIDGILSSEVNTAARIMKWVEVGTRFSDIPGQLMIVDNLEQLDEANRAVFEEVIRKSGLQFFVAVLDAQKGGPLRVETSILKA